MTLYDSNITAPTTQTAYGTVVTASSTTHTKGSYTQLIASTSFDTFLVYIRVSIVSVAANNTSMLMDFAVGGAGSETVIIPDLNVGYAGSNHLLAHYFKFPLFIPSGSRIAARCQSARSSGTARVQIQVLGAPRQPCWFGEQVTAYGVDSSTSRATTTVTPGNNGAEGSWTQIVGSLGDDVKWLVPCVDGGGTTLAARDIWMDVALGGSGSEQQLFENSVYITTTGNEEVSLLPGPHGWAGDIPAGSRLSARMSQVNNSTQIPLGVSFHGIN